MTNTVSVLTPTQFGVGDGETTRFHIGAPGEIVQSLSPTGIWREDWQGNRRLYPTPRTNSVIYSVARATGWSRLDSGVLTPAFGTAPDGSSDSGLLSTTSAGTTPGCYPGGTSSATYTAGVKYVASVWFKANTDLPSKRVRLFFNASSFGQNKAVYFNVSNGTVSVVGGTSVPESYGSQVYPDGWTRVWLSQTATVTGASYPPIIRYFDPISPGEGVEYWGLQFEIGTAPTGYIRTDGEAVTVTDYSAAPTGLITMGQVPAIGAALTWTGSYTYENPDDGPTLADRTIISQYANSPTLRQLIRNMDEYINPDADFDRFYDYVWNVETAQGFGLDIWGKIVGVGRQLTIPGAETFLGFKEAYTAATALTGAQPFGQATFWRGEQSTQTYTLADDAYRTLILVKALANISDCTIPSLNRLLQNLFAGRGRCYVNDLGDMRMRYTFEFYLQPFELAILTQSNAIPRPAAVQASIAEIPTPNIFGFSEAGEGVAPFNYGTLFTGVINAS
ncbi:DUF2612 domain-containing protein [Bordetella hinzii]|uniref:DUF2612 domain-containing protein n=1 Tax=Bordetella hinzii TaxID=103855 RepID=UPI0021AD91F0|nr:DUF2612 domain-containing protein [Bordetella hinzii]